MLQDKLVADLKRFIDVPDNSTESGKILLKTIVQSILEVYTMVLKVNPLLPLQATPAQQDLVIFNTIVKLPELPDEEFISIPDFIEQYRLDKNGKKIKLATDGSMSAALRDDDELVKYAADRGPNGNRWFIKPLHFIHYLSRSRRNPKLRNRCKEWLIQEKRNLC